MMTRSTAAPDVTDMHEVRLVGRGGHGVVTAGEVLGRAAVAEGRSAQAIPTFGPERRGALSSCTLRIATGEILLKCGPTGPDVLVVLDPTIWRHVPVTPGLREGATLVFNTTLEPADLAAALRLPLREFTLWTVDATSIALAALGRAVTNTAMMGAFAGATGLLRMESVEGAIRDRFGAAADGNIEAARAARERMRRL